MRNYEHELAAVRIAIANFKLDSRLLARVCKSLAGSEKNASRQPEPNAKAKAEAKAKRTPKKPNYRSL